MSLTVLEQFVEAKTAGRVCEDIIVVTGDFSAVIDGASDATGARFDGRSGGRLAAEVVANAVSVLPADAGARSFADSLSDALAAAVTAMVGTLGPDTRWPVAVLTCVSAHRRQVWRIGDGNVVIGGTPHLGLSRIDEAAYSFRAATNAALLARGMPLHELIESDPGAAAVRILSDNQQNLTNKVSRWGRGSINGSRVPDEYIEILPIPDGPTEVILTTDGFPVPLATLAESEAELAEMVSRDPAAVDELWAIGKPMKSGANAPDDRAYLRLTID